MKRLIVLMLVVGLACSAANSALVAHWTFDEAGGSTAYDSANGYHGTIHGADWTNGIIGGALSFDGVDDYVGTLNDIFSNAQLASGATLTAWFKTDSTAYGYMADNEGYMSLGVNHIYAPYPNKLVGVVDGGYNRFFSSPNVNDNFWHHAAIVWNGTDTVSLYLDGVIVSFGLSGPPNPDSETRSFTIGRHSDLSKSWFFDGLVDDVRIYNHALTTGEIQQLIPEPASAMILGLGSLIFSLRRKR